MILSRVASSLTERTVSVLCVTTGIRCCHSFKLCQSIRQITSQRKSIIASLHRSYSLSSTSGEPPTEPYAGGYKNPLEMVKNEFRRYGGGMQKEPPMIPRNADVVIVGGGAIGMSAAYWLKQRNPEGISVTVIERDPSYMRAATTLSVGGIRQQFSLEENIRMSMFSAEFLRDIKQYLSVLDLEPPDVCFNHQGYLFLATPGGMTALEENHNIQSAMGAQVDLMTRDLLSERFPWLNVEDVALGSYGIQNEGWFDPWLLLVALKTKAASLGVNFVTGDVCGFTAARQTMRSLGAVTADGTVEGGGNITDRSVLEHVHVKSGDGKVHPIQFAMILNCAGPWSREVARLAGIGTGDGATSVDLPVEPRKRYVFMFHCPDGPGLDCPMLVDSSGVYVRREGLGGNYICGASPKPGDPDNMSDNLDVDYEFFNEQVWPALAHRVPAFEKLKLRSAWAGFYDYNYFDQNLIIGNHPYHRNFFMATGCSGHGIQHSPAIGRAIMEYMTDDDYRTIDLSRMSFDRILDDKPLLERGII